MVNRNTKGHVLEYKRRHVRLQLNIRHLIKRRQITHTWNKKTQLNTAKKLLFFSRTSYSKNKNMGNGHRYGDFDVTLQCQQTSYNQTTRQATWQISLFARHSELVCLKEKR